MRDRRPRPGWVVLGCAILTAGSTGPGQTIGVSVFIDHLVDDLSLSRSQVSAAYLVGTLAGASMLPTVGKLIDRYGVRIAQVVIGLMFGVALVNMSLVNGLVWLAIGFGGIRFLGQGSLSLVSTVTVQVRFERSRGLAVGIFTTATAGLMAMVPVVLSVVIDAWGWRSPGSWPPSRWSSSSCRSPGSVCATCREVVPRAEGTAPAEGSYDRAGAVRTSSFWMLVAVTGAAGMMSTALNFHQIDLLGDAGLSETAAAALFIPQVIGSSVAGLTIGYVGDRLGTRYLPAISMGLLLAAQLLAAVASPGVTVLAMPSCSVRQAVRCGRRRRRCSHSGSGSVISARSRER